MTGELTVKEYNLEYEPECQVEEQVIESITKEEIVEDDAGIRSQKEKMRSQFQRMGLKTS